MRRPGRAAPVGRVPRSHRRAELRHGIRLGPVGPAGHRTRPAGLHPFREIRAADRHAVSTLATCCSTSGPGGWTCASSWPRRSWAARRRCHLGRRGARFPLLRRARPARLRRRHGESAASAACNAAIIGAEDPAFAGGSYVIVQKYLHDMDRWNALPDRAAGAHHRPQEALRCGAERRRQAAYAHNALTPSSRNGRELQILRDNMPFGRPGQGEFGTYFIGYCRSPDIPSRCWRTCSSASRRATTTVSSTSVAPSPASLFFVPSLPLLESLADDGGDGQTTAPMATAPGGWPAAGEAAAQPPGSLGIGSLGGAPSD